MRAHATSFLLTALLIGGCVHPHTAYVPVGAIRTADAIIPATPYAIAGDHEKGTVHVVSMDAERLPVGPGAPDLYLHVRLLAENGGDDTIWALNPNDQMLSHSGGMVSPSFSKTSAQRPVLSLARGNRGWMDLYYPLPADIDPLEVKLWWRVRRGATAVSHSTTFMRISGRDPVYEGPYESYDAAPLPAGLALGWWWPEPCFAGGGYYGGGGWASRHHGRPRRSSSAGSQDHPPQHTWASASDSSSSSSSSPSSDSGSWRNPAPASDPGAGGGGGGASSSAGDSQKSDWRR